MATWQPMTLGTGENKTKKTTNKTKGRRGNITKWMKDTTRGTKREESRRKWGNVWKRIRRKRRTKEKFKTIIIKNKKQYEENARRKKRETYFKMITRAIYRI